MILLISLAFLGAESLTYIPSMSWYNPRIMAMGGEVSADPDGFSAFVSNPAGFAGEKKVDSKTGETVRKGEFYSLFPADSPDSQSFSGRGTGRSYR